MRTTGQSRSALRLARADRHSLLLGTALASTLLIGTLLAPRPAMAVTACPQPPSPNPIVVNVNDAVTCINTEPRTSAGFFDAISIFTTGAGHYIDLYNSGPLTGTGIGNGGIRAGGGPDSPVSIVNAGDIVTDGQQAYGIQVNTNTPPQNGAGGDGGNGGVAVAGNGGNAAGGVNGANGGDVASDGGDGGGGIGGGSGDIVIVNSGDITTLGLFSDGIHGRSTTNGGYGGDGGDAGAAFGGFGGNGDALGGNGGNGGNASAHGGAGGAGAGAVAGGITIITSGDITTLGDSAVGIYTGSEAGDPFGGAGGSAAGTIAQGGVGGAGAVGNGGNGGNGGSASANAGAGGTAFGGAAGDIMIVNSAGITTSGYSSHGMHVRAFAGNGRGDTSDGGAGGVATGGAGGPGGVSGLGGNGGDAHANGGAGGAATAGKGAGVNIVNSGHITILQNYSNGMFINTYGGSGLAGAGSIGGVALGGDGSGAGISADGGDGGGASANGGAGGTAIGGDGGDTTIVNEGDVVTSGRYAEGIYVRSFAGSGRGDVAPGGTGGVALGGDGGVGGFGNGGDGGSTLANGGDGGTGIGGDGGDVTITNNGYVVTSGDYSHGIRVFASGSGGDGGDGGAGGTASSGAGGNGLTLGAGGDGGDASANGGAGGTGIGGDGGNIVIVNTGHVMTAGLGAHGIYAYTRAGTGENGADGADGGALHGTNGLGPFGGAGGTPQANGGAGGLGIGGDSGQITIENSSSVIAGGDAVRAIVQGGSGTILVDNSGTLFGGNTTTYNNYYGTYTITNAGIHVASPNRTTIINSGYLSSESLLAIHSVGPGNVQIFNSGVITGYVLLDADDRFINQSGGVFETKLTSDFGDSNGAGDNDLFRNEQGGTVQAAGNANAGETSAFVNLERFENRGLISLQDGAPGDTFQIANTAGGTGLDFAASGNSTLAVDAFLGGPGSTADNFIIDGNVSGKTAVQVNNTNTGPGVFNSKGIPVVFGNGATPNADAFFLSQPIDTGFFAYDLFFEPTGSGIWEFRSFPGGGALLLPQLTTAAQDIWHQGSSTWFDRTADLRVLLAGGVAPAYDPNAIYADQAAGAHGAPSITPAVWVRGAGAWLDRDDSATTTASGRSFAFDLDRDLDVLDFQMGLDLGHRDLLSPGDILVFGVLGGFVEASLDYDSIVREFDFDGGQVGAYATYLKGGLFVDTLLNAHLYELDANGTLGFPSELDASTVGLRTDTGYRFGSFSGGVFLEPLATVEVLWADIDGFSQGGNTVSFDDEANVRGRLGLRAGTTMQAWEGTIMEPFVIGSLWGNFTDDNQATLVSSGTTFRFEDDLDDVWGEVSAGVNFFNPSATTAVFAKVDVTFGDDVEGVGGKAGMRVSW